MTTFDVFITNQALIGADLVRGYGYFHGGILRTVFVLSKTETVQVAPFSCLKQLYHPFMHFGQQASPTMVLALALDRMFAVLLYKQYRNWSNRYAFTI